MTGRLENGRGTPDEVERLRARVAELEARVRAQDEALRAARAAYHALASYSQQGLVIIKGGRVVFAGPGVEGLLRFPADQFAARAGYYLAGLVHPDDYAALRTTLLAAERGDQSFDAEARHEARLLTYGGDYGRFALAIRAMTHEGQPALQVTFINTQDLIQVEDALREREARLSRAESNLLRSEQKYRQFVEQSADAIWLCDVHGKILEWNRGAEQLTGFSRDRIIGQPIGEVLAELSGDAGQAVREGVGHQLAVFVETLPSEQMFSLPVHRRDGEIRHTQMLVFPIFGDEELLIGAITRDITDRLRAERDAVQLRLERARVELLTDFIRDASHEFRTPLSIINTHLYMMRRMPAAESLIDRLNTIGEQTEYLHSLLESMLTMARLDSKNDWQFDAIPVERLVDSLMTRVLPMAEENGLAMQVSIAERLPALVCDEIELYTALLAILTNAVQYTPMPGTVVLRVDRVADFLRFTVSDTGIGIPAEALPHLFDRFFRVDTARSRLGAGLGLCIARRIVEQHGGTIEVASVEGQGSTFTVLLPVEPSSARG